MDDDEIIPPWDGDEEYPFDDSHDDSEHNWHRNEVDNSKKERKRSLRDHRKGKNKRDNPNY